MSIETIEFDVVELVEQVCAMFSRIAGDRGVALVCRVAPALSPRYLGDPVRLRQIVSSQTSNALKFTEEGRVVVDLREHDGWLAIAVEDVGIGIEPARQPFIFDAFTQADATISWRFGGTGLALCQRMAGLIGAALTVDSTPGRGSTFMLALPCRSVLDGG